MYDFCVVGAGIVGLATAMRLLELRPGSSVVVLEKESGVGLHQTGHNSGVIHAGVYYAPGSLKATLCRAGAKATKAFAEKHGVPYEVCGKLLVATSPEEMVRMEALKGRCADNGIDVTRLSRDELADREPAIAGLGALHVPSSGIIDYRRLCDAMVSVIIEAGGELRLNTSVEGIREDGNRVEVISAKDTINARRLVVCGGLQSDRLARMAGLDTDFQIVPFRGEYFSLPPEHASRIRHLIYPIPDPDLPFLGIHLTRMIDGSVTVGPNAVLGFSREGYRKLSFSAGDITDMVAFPGFWRVLATNWRSGVREMRNSLWRAGYLEECKKYYPDLKKADLKPHPAGIRAQAVRRDGTLVHDFLFASTDRTLHVCNAPSPAATSAIPIARMIADQILN